MPERGEREAVGAHKRQLKETQLPGKLLTNGATAWLCVFFAAFLLLLGSKGYKQISLFKTTLFYVLALQLILLLVLLAAITLIRARNRRQKPSLAEPRALLKPAVPAAVGYLLFVWVSALLSPSGSKAVYSSVTHENALTLSTYVVCFLLLSLWARPGRAVLYVIYSAAGAFSCFILIQLLGVNLFGLYPGDGNYYLSAQKHAGNFIGTVGNADLASATLSLLLPICLAGGLTARKWYKLIGLLLAALCGVELVLIKVMAGVVGVLAGGVLAAFLLVPVRRKVKLWCLLGLGAAACVGFAVLWSRDFSYQPLHELHEILHGRIDDTFGTGRVFIWRQMLKRIPERLFFGFGPDTVRYTGLSPFLRYDEAGRIAAAASLTDAHCLPLEILYCTGLFSLLAWLAMVGWVLIPWARRKDRSRTSTAVGAGLLCFSVTMLFTISSVIIMPFFWCLLGLLNGENIQKTTRPPT